VSTLSSEAAVNTVARPQWVLALRRGRFPPGVNLSAEIIAGHGARMCCHGCQTVAT
jgi:hypothetical protein